MTWLVWSDYTSLWRSLDATLVNHEERLGILELGDTVEVGKMWGNENSGEGKGV